jgi:hypothetical protein
MTVGPKSPISEPVPRRLSLRYWLGLEGGGLFSGQEGRPGYLLIHPVQQGRGDPRGASRVACG